MISLGLLAFVNPKPGAKKAIVLVAFEAADSSRIENLKSQFNGRSVHRCYLSLMVPVQFGAPISHAGGNGRQTHIEAQKAAGLAMRTQAKDRRDDLIPVVVTALVAVISTAAILFGDFAPSNTSQGSGDAITAAAVSRAGAVLTPSEPAAGRPAA